MSYPRPTCRGRFLGTVSLLLALCLPTVLHGQAARSDSLGAPVGTRSVPLYPEFRTRREIALSGGGVGLLAASLLVPADGRVVPEQGFDPVDIAWSWDRSVVGNSSLSAADASDWTRNASLVLPVVLTLLTDPGGGRLERSGLLYAQTMLVSLGFTRLGKVALSRARPFAYLANGDRPEGASYDVSRERAFHSMPSGHASSAWTGAAFGITEHLLRRPNASWVERTGIGFLGGALAGATSASRVEAGQHFPSDVIVGAGIGIATGVTIPLLHSGGQPLPSQRAWLQTTGGVLAGTLVGVLLSQGP